jgi:hypothetical protein
MLLEVTWPELEAIIHLLLERRLGVCGVTTPLSILQTRVQRYTTSGISLVEFRKLSDVSANIVVAICVLTQRLNILYKDGNHSVCRHVDNFQNLMQLILKSRN